MAMRSALALVITRVREKRVESNMPRSILVTHGDMLCEVRFWGEAEWAALPEVERPRECFHKPGGGWVGIVPAAGMSRI
jgi:hypothetical protein